MLLASPGLAAVPRLLHYEDLPPSTVPLLAPEAAQLPFTAHLPALNLQGRGAMSTPLPLSLPAMPDEGGGAGVSNDTLGVLGILLALFIGFGTGHLVVRDRDGFILFLIVDVVILVVASVLSFAVAPGLGWWWLGYNGLGGLALLVSHLIQVLDVYGKAFGGGRILDRARDSTMVIDKPAWPEPQMPATHRVLRFSF